MKIENINIINIVAVLKTPFLNPVAILLKGTCFHAFTIKTIVKLMNLGVMASINQSIDYDTFSLIALFSLKYHLKRNKCKL